MSTSANFAPQRGWFALLVKTPDRRDGVMEVFREESEVGLAYISKTVQFWPQIQFLEGP